MHSKKYCRMFKEPLLEGMREKAMTHILEYLSTALASHWPGRVIPYLSNNSWSL
jgi:hypothetical protein